MFYSPESKTIIVPGTEASEQVPLQHADEDRPNQTENAYRKIGTYPYLEMMAMTKEAKLICEGGDFFKATEELEGKELMTAQTERVKAMYGGRLEKNPGDEPWIGNNGVWDMITALELFDPATWEHSLRVFETVRNTIDNNRHIGLFMKQKLAEENITRDDLLLAALLHDVGKFILPKPILDDETRDIEWHARAWVHMDPEDYRTFLRKLESSPGLRAKDLIPYVLSADEAQLSVLTAREIDPTLPLGRIIAMHEQISALILRSYGHIIPAEIAEHHHSTAPIGTEEHPVAISSLRASTIIHMLDIIDAIKDPNRSYREDGTMLDALRILALEALDGHIDRTFAAILIRDMMFNQKPELKEALLSKVATPIRQLLDENPSSHATDRPAWSRTPGTDVRTESRNTVPRPRRTESSHSSRTPKRTTGR